MDPVIKSYADNGIVALSFGLLLLYFLWERRDDRKNQYEERKAQDVERAKFVEIAQGTVQALNEIKSEVKALREEMNRNNGK